MLSRMFLLAAVWNTVPAFAADSGFLALSYRGKDNVDSMYVKFVPSDLDHELARESC